MKNIVVLLAAGNGSRMKKELPKQFIEINNKPIFIWTLENFIQTYIDKIVLVINKDYLNLYKSYLEKYNINNIDLVFGGNSRQESVHNALLYLENSVNKDDIILLHDGARPLINESIIQENINVCKKYNSAVITSLNIVDTLVDKEYNLIDRDLVLSVQTPQTFPYKIIKDIHTKAKNDHLNQITDDGQLAKMYGYQINYVKGSRLNIKITEQEDLIFFKKINGGD